MGVQSSFHVQGMGGKHNTYRHFLCTARGRVWVVNRAKVTLLSPCVGTEQPGPRAGGSGDTAGGSQDTGLMLSVVSSTFPMACERPWMHLCYPTAAAPPLSPHRIQISNSCRDGGAVRWGGVFFPPRHRNLESCKDLPRVLLAAQQSRSGISRCHFPGVAGQAVAAGGPPAPHCPARAGKL